MQHIKPGVRLFRESSGHLYRDLACGGTIRCRENRSESTTDRPQTRILVLFLL